MVATFPGLRSEHDLYLDPRQTFVPLSNSTLDAPPRPHRNLSTLSRFALGASFHGTMLVTDCSRDNVTRLQGLLVGAPANVSLDDAIAAFNVSTLTCVVGGNAVRGMGT